MSCTPGNGTGLRLMTGSNSGMIKIEQSAFICRSCDFLYCLWSDLEKLWSGHRRSMVDIEDRRSISSSTVRLWVTIFAYPPPSRILSTLALHRTASYTDKCEVTKWMLPMKTGCGTCATFLCLALAWSRLPETAGSGLWLLYARLR